MIECIIRKERMVMDVGTNVKRIAEAGSETEEIKAN